MTEMLRAFTLTRTVELFGVLLSFIVCVCVCVCVLCGVCLHRVAYRKIHEGDFCILKKKEHASRRRRWHSQ